MSAIEFSAQSGKTFSVQLYHATTGDAIGSPITGVTDGTTPTLYRANTGTNTGTVYVLATATNLHVAGFADLSNPGTNGYSQLKEFTAASSAAITVLPSQVQQNPTIRLKTGSTKAKTVTVEENLTGKTLKLFVRTKQDVFVAEISVTAANGSYSFTPTEALTAKTCDYFYAVREVSDGNNSLYDGILQVAYAADGE